MPGPLPISRRSFARLSIAGATATMFGGGREALSLMLPKAAILSNGTVCAALLRLDGTGPILGAGWMPAAGA
jgi:hypothetical protein